LHEGLGGFDILQVEPHLGLRLIEFSIKVTPRSPARSVITSIQELTEPRFWRDDMLPFIEARSIHNGRKVSYATRWVRPVRRSSLQGGRIPVSLSLIEKVSHYSIKLSALALILNRVTSMADDYQASLRGLLERVE
jgi:hypothetical protein